MGKDKLFISYSRIDADIVLKLAAELKNVGANLWLDQFDIAAGSTWDHEIEKALVSCDCVLFMVSAASVASNNVMNEVYYALDEKKRVLPIKINDCKIPFRIKRLHYIDLNANYDNGFKALLSNLQLSQIGHAESTKTIIKKAAEKQDKDEEIKLWNQANQLNSKKLYEDYLNQYPEGAYSFQAKTNLEQLISAEQEQKVQMQEADSWDDAKRINSTLGYRQYLDSSLLKTYSEDANKAIEYLSKYRDGNYNKNIWKHFLKRFSKVLGIILLIANVFIIYYRVDIIEELITGRPPNEVDVSKLLLPLILIVLSFALMFKNDANVPPKSHS